MGLEVGAMVGFVVGSSIITEGRREGSSVGELLVLGTDDNDERLVGTTVGIREGSAVGEAESENEGTPDG